MSSRACASGCSRYSRSPWNGVATFLLALKLLGVLLVQLILEHSLSPWNDIAKFILLCGLIAQLSMESSPRLWDGVANAVLDLTRLNGILCQPLRRCDLASSNIESYLTPRTCRGPGLPFPLPIPSYTGPFPLLLPAHCIGPCVCNPLPFSLYPCSPLFRFTLLGHALAL